MSPLPQTAVNDTLTTQGLSFSSNASDTISTIIFGVLAVVASAIGIWQARKAWHIWQEHRHPTAITPPGTRGPFQISSRPTTDIISSSLGTLPTFRSHGLPAAIPLHQLPTTNETTHSTASTNTAMPIAATLVHETATSNTPIRSFDTETHAQTSLSTVDPTTPPITRQATDTSNESQTSPSTTESATPPNAHPAALPTSVNSSMSTSVQDVIKTAVAGPDKPDNTQSILSGNNKAGPRHG